MGSVLLAHQSASLNFLDTAIGAGGMTCSIVGAAVIGAAPPEDPAAARVARVSSASITFPGLCFFAKALGQSWFVQNPCGNPFLSSIPQLPL